MNLASGCGTDCNRPTRGRVLREPQMCAWGKFGPKADPTADVWRKGTRVALRQKEIAMAISTRSGERRVRSLARFVALVEMIHED